MGSFNVACAISKLHINEGDKVALLPIVKPKYAYDPRFAPTGMTEPGSTFARPTRYLPYCPPIYGKYDDYGSISEIKETTTTKFLENKIGKPIQAIVSCLSDTREIYSSMSTINEVFAPKDFYKLSYDAKIEAIVNYGFVQNKKEKHIYTYNQASIDSKERVIVTARGYRQPIPNSVHDAEGYLQAFADYTGMWPGFAKEDWESITLLYALGGTFYLPQFVEPVKAVLEEDFLYKRDVKMFQEAWDETQTYIDGTKERIWATDLPYYKEMRNLWAMDVVSALEFYQTVELEEVKGLIDLNSVFIATNTSYYPSYCGAQFEDVDVEDAVVKTMKKILKKRREEQNWD